MNSFKPLLGILIAIGFLVMSFYLIKQKEQLAVVIGYIGIFWWGSLLLFAIYKKLKKNK